MNLTLPLSLLFSVFINISQPVAASPAFNQGLVIGSSAVISGSTRLTSYDVGSWSSEMLNDGFVTTSPEYIAVGLYFAQAGPPQIVWVGRQDLTANETPAQAVTLCRLMSSAWYTCMSINAAAADHLAIAQYAQTATPQMMYHGTTPDAAVLAGTSGNVCSLLKSLARSRSFMLYSTTQAGAAPNNAYASAATMGVAMGLNTGLANSYFTMKFKNLVGVVTEPITSAQATILDTNGANVFASYVGAYSFLQEGKVSSGQFYDEVLNLDMLASDAQYNVVAAYASNAAIQQNNQGQQILITAVNQAAAASASRGFLTSGTYQGQTILNLSAGTALPSGYLAQSQPFSAQSASDKALRKMMPIYLSILEGQAAHSGTLQINVQR